MTKTTRHLQIIKLIGHEGAGDLGKRGGVGLQAPLKTRSRVIIRFIQRSDRFNNNFDLLNIEIFAFF